MKKEVISIRKEILGYDNLIPPFTEFRKHANAIVEDYKLTLNATGAYQTTFLKIEGKPNTTYTLDVDITGTPGYVRLDYQDAYGTMINYFQTKVFPHTFTTPPGTQFLYLQFSNDNSGQIIYDKPMLVEDLKVRDFVRTGQLKPIKERIKYSGYVEEVRIRFYAGVEKALQVKPYVLRDGRRIEDLFTYPEGTDQYITGDDDYLVFPVSAEINTDDELIVEYRNLEKDFVYTLSIDFVLIYNMEAL